MKSVVVEASTVAKAIETAWLKAEKPEEFFIRVLQEHTSGFFGFGAQKAKIVFFFKNTHKSDSLFPVVVKQKEYSSFFGNSNLKVPAQLNFVDVDLNKNVILNPTHKKKPHNNQSNQQKPKQNNNVPVQGKPTENQVVNKPIFHKVPHADKNLQGQAVKQIKIQHNSKPSDVASSFAKALADNLHSNDLLTSVPKRDGLPAEARKSEGWWVMTGSNCRPSPCKGDALPTELITRKIIQFFEQFFIRKLLKFSSKKFTYAKFKTLRCMYINFFWEKS